MLNLATNLRESGRFPLITSALALMLGAACLLALAIGVAGAKQERGAVRTSEAVNRFRSATPPIRTALGERRNAHRRLNVAWRRPVAGTATGEPEAPSPQPVNPPSSPPAVIDLPVAITKPPAFPGSTPPLEQPPAPDPTPEPEESIPPPPPPEPEPPAPEPEPEPAPSPQPDGEVLFKATFDSGFGGWYVQSLSGRATTSSSDPFEGGRAARFEVRPGDVEPDTGSQRSEVSGPTFKEGEDLYIRDAIRVPSGNTVETPWEIIQQLHEENWNGSPGMAVFLNSDPALRIGAGDGSPTYWTSSTIEENRWYELIYRVNLSQDPAAGFVEVWLDGAQQQLSNGQTRMYGQTMQTDETYLKAGIYRSKSSTGTSIVEHDSIVVGTSLAAVMGA